MNRRNLVYLPQNSKNVSRLIGLKDNLLPQQNISPTKRRLSNVTKLGDEISNS
jgi:hypothetical protein